MAMKHGDLNANAVLRLSELACWVDAIPARFRTPIMEAALGMLPAVDWQGSPLVQSLRSQIQDCVDDCVGFSIDDRAWRRSDLSGLRSACESLSGCTSPVEVELTVSKLVSRLAEALLSAAREAQS